MQTNTKYNCFIEPAFIEVLLIAKALYVSAVLTGRYIEVAATLQHNIFGLGVAD